MNVNNFSDADKKSKNQRIQRFLGEKPHLSIIMLVFASSTV